MNPGMTIQYRGDDWIVLGKSKHPNGWWIQRVVDGRNVVVEALRKEISQADVR